MKRNDITAWSVPAISDDNILPDTPVPRGRDLDDWRREVVHLILQEA